jgi:hypothetical protein
MSLKLGLAQRKWEEHPAQEAAGKMKLKQEIAKGKNCKQQRSQSHNFILQITLK